ncbi:hypothetical protein ACLOJK_002718 [Asimina triloba]
MTQVFLLKQKALSQANDAKGEGNKLFGAGQYEDALQQYALALQLAPEIPSSVELRSICHANSAACFSKLGKYNDTIKECTKALELNPTYMKALVRRGEAHENLENFEDAIADMKKILELDASNLQARRAIQRLEPLAAEKREKMKEEMIGEEEETIETRRTLKILERKVITLGEVGWISITVNVGFSVGETTARLCLQGCRAVTGLLGLVIAKTGFRKVMGGGGVAGIQGSALEGKLKDLGNNILGRFGMSVDNFKAVKDPNTVGLQSTIVPRAKLERRQSCCNGNKKQLFSDPEKSQGLVGLPMLHEKATLNLQQARYILAFVGDNSSWSWQ